MVNTVLADRRVLADYWSSFKLLEFLQVASVLAGRLTCKLKDYYPGFPFFSEIASFFRNEITPDLLLLPMYKAAILRRYPGVKAGSRRG